MTADGIASGLGTRKGGTIQGAVEAFGAGADYPDYIRTVAARASGTGAAVTIAVVNRAHWRQTGERQATANVDEEQCGICREGGEHNRQLTRWPGGRPHWFHDECIAALYQRTEGGDPRARRAEQDWKGAHN